MELVTKTVRCPAKTSHKVCATPDGRICCGNCGSLRIVMVGTAPRIWGERGWCEDYDYCKDCKYITWPGHFTGTYEDGKRVLDKWYTRPASEDQIKEHEH